jgi:predicted permease
VVVAVTILVACAASCVATLAPLWSLRRIDLASQLQTGGRGGTAPSARNVRRGLVIAQVAFAILVVAAAGLLTRSLLRLQSVDKGFAGEQLVFVELTMPGIFGDRVRHGQFLERAIAALQSSPAIAAATPVNNAPFAGAWDVPKFTAEGQGVERAAVNPSLNLESVYPNYFGSLQIQVVRGRAFTDADREGAPGVAIVSDDVAAQTWPGADALGKRIKFGGPESREGWLTIVGVAASTRYRELTRPSPTLYLPAAQFQVTAEVFVLRTTAALDLVASLARDQIRAVDPNVRVVRVSSFSRMLEAPLARPRFNAFLLGIFGIAALVLSTVGLYGVMTAFVRQRDREIALRIALGASAANVRRLVLAETAWLAGVGTLLGLAAAAAGSRIIQGFVHDAVPLDPVSLLAAALLLILASGLATLVPMRRAASVDAVAVLRN